MAANCNVTGAGTLVVPAGATLVSDAGNNNRISNLTINGGTLEGSGTVTVTGRFNLSDGGQLAAVPGQLGTLVLQGFSNVSTILFRMGMNVTNSGHMTVNVHLWIFTNRLTFNNSSYLSLGAFSASFNFVAVATARAGVLATIQNSGSFLIGANTFFVGRVTFNNLQTADALYIWNNVSFSHGASLTDNGEVYVGAGASLVARVGGVFRFVGRGCSMAGGGLYAVAGGNMFLDATGTLTPEFFTLANQNPNNAAAGAANVLGSLQLNGSSVLAAQNFAYRGGEIKAPTAADSLLIQVGDQMLLYAPLVLLNNTGISGDTGFFFETGLIILMPPVPATPGLPGGSIPPAVTPRIQGPIVLPAPPGFTAPPQLIIP